MKLAIISIIALSGLLAVSGAKPPGPPMNPRMAQRTTVAHPEVIDHAAKPKMPAASHQTTPQRRASCDKAGLIAATGSDLVDKVRAAEQQCINQLFSVTGNDARLAFNLEDMMTIAYEFYSGAYYYDALDPGAESLIQFVLYLRAGFYVNFYHKEATGGNYDATLYAYVEHGIRFFFDRPNLDAKNDLHYDVFAETLILVTNADLNLELLDEVVDILRQITSWSSWSLKEYGQGNTVNSIFNIYWRLTWEEEANKQLPSKPDAPLALDNFMNKRANLLATESEWLLANAGGELARLLQFNSIKSKVSPLVKTQITKYSLSYGPKVWIAMASSIDNFDQENCDFYGTCNFRETAKASILPYKKVCAITKVDQFTVIAQKISPAQMDEVCTRLKAHEQYFHSRLTTNWNPVKDDDTRNLNVVIYASSDDYSSYNYALYGYDTNNGGIYIEGDPSQPNNIGQFFCYVQHDWDGKWDVWNLEHEITHYFDGRYDMYGDFPNMNSYPTVWWSEGLGEYMAHKDNYDSAKSTCTAKQYVLSSIFMTTYEEGTEKVYRYGYSAVRFMFERHRSEVDTLLGFFRTGKFKEYTSYIKFTIGTKYDAEHSKWCDCLAKGQC